MKISVVIRTLNEAKYLSDLLVSIRQQATQHDIEVIVVDSGSTDSTLRVAESGGAHIIHIAKHEFSFGRSLNMGCEAASGEILVFVSGHCVPVDEQWIESLIGPIVDERAIYCYGRQLGRDTTRFSEHQVFEKYFPETSAIPQDGFFCNNANAALKRDVWNRFRFNEELTGLEDMYLAKQLVVAGNRIAYVADAKVYHIHDESWSRIRIRYERESIALREIMPEVHISLLDLLRWITVSISSDLRVAFARGRIFGVIHEICLYRINQFWGGYRGNHDHKKMSRERKQRYFYPKGLL